MVYESPTLEDLQRESSDPSNRWWENDEPAPKPKPKKLSPDGLDLNGRPNFVYGAGNLHEAVARTAQHLMDDDVQFFDRGGLLYRPLSEETIGPKGQALKSARLIPVALPYLLKQMSASINWLTLKKVKDDFIKVKIDPPTAVASSILTDAGDWPFRKIAGIITAPTLRRDGSILWREGYDDKTKLLLVSPPDMPDFPQNPTQADAKMAMQRISRLFDAFPFVDKSSRSVALSGFLTPIARSAMSVAPLHVISAPASGTGKSFLVDICSAVISGNSAAALSAGKNEEETEKRLGAAFMEGAPILLLDNVNGQLYGDALCQCVERPMVKFRVLGASRTMEIENKTTMFATGNNISLVDDMARRSLMCRLDSNVERPEMRQFNVNPVDTVLQDRGRYIADALTVLRAYKLAGSPDRLPRLASFEEWSDLVRSALVWLGYEDPLLSMERVRDADGRLDAAKSFVSSWWDATKGQKKTAAQIVDLSMNNTELQVAMKGFVNPRGPLVDGTQLGNRMRVINERIYDGFKVYSQKDLHTKANMWWLEKIAGASEKNAGTEDFF